jgi:ribosomal protein L3 glutamine methyltransferase
MARASTPAPRAAARRAASARGRPPGVRACLREAATRFATPRDFIRLAVSLAEREGVFFGHGSGSAWDEAVYLVLRALDLPPDRLEPFLDARLLAHERRRIVALLARRIEDRVPAAYLTGEAWLGDVRFRVDSRVIVPRSFIAELLREDLSPLGLEDERVGRVLDLCTGSGCLAILAALRFPHAQVDAVDLSAQALEVAAVNVAEHGVDDRVHLLRGDLWRPLAANRYDLILANPPYVDAPAMARLPREYRHEPALALAGGEDGLDIVRRILEQAPAHLQPGGLLLMEVGHSRSALEAAFPRLPLIWVETSAEVSSVCAIRREDLEPANAARPRPAPLRSRRPRST